MIPKTSFNDHLGKARIVIVEDELIISADIASRLKRLGYEVIGQADHADDALRMCHELRPDLVLMDIRLQGPVDGISIAEAIRKKNRTPVVFLTAHADETTLHRAKLTQPDGYVLKPFEERELRIVIETALYRAEAQRKVDENRRYLATLLQSVGEAVIATDPQGKIDYANELACRMLQLPISEVHERTIDEVVNLFDGETARKISVSSFSTRSSQQERDSNECTLVQPDGQQRIVVVSANHIELSDGSIKGTVYVIRDKTIERLLEQRIKQGQKMEAIGHMAAGIAHDFNNILTVISINKMMLMELNGDSPERLAMLKNIEEAANRATRLTDQLSAIGQNKVVQPKRLQLNLIIEETWNMLQTLIPKTIHCSCHLCPDSLTVMADQSQIEQVILNLVLNARNAMPKGGNLKVSTRLQQNCLDLRDGPGPAAILSIEDTGAGMDAVTKSRIWEPFYTTQNGTGLGLSVVYGVVQQCRGHISVETAINQGSVFRVSFPCV
jgi:two-component system, cell cycle sensor histidine kinase and response regulator CckA